MSAFKQIDFSATGSLQGNVSEFHTNMKAILDRGISFSDNVDCRLVTFTSSATPSAENTITHTLGKIPKGYIVYRKNKAAHVYDGTTAWTTSSLYLKVDVASVAVYIIIF